MIWDAISEKLIQQGYVQSTRDRRIAEFLIQITEDKKMNICSIIKNVNGVWLTADQIVDSAKQLERKFLLSGYSDVTVMHIIFTDHAEQVSMLEEENIRFWLVDMKDNRLKIFENQPDDYCGTKKVIEHALENMSQEEPDRKVKQRKPAGRVSFVTAAIVVVNIMVFFLCEFLGSTEDTGFMVNMGAMEYRRMSENHEFYRLLTCMFLHFGLAHLVNNMFMLGVVGTQVEQWLGHLRYALIYLISGLGASITSLAYHRIMGEDVVSAGASGAIYGIFGALLIMILKKRADETTRSRVLFVVALLIIGSFQENVDFAAHVGGLVVGVITTCAMPADVRKISDERNGRTNEG